MPMAESKIAEAECIPSASIPHITSLYSDFLHRFENVSRFFARPPLDTNWLEDEKKRIIYPKERREAVAAILEQQNRAFGAGEKTLANIQRLRDGAPVIATGQQVVLFGGPMFCILKALSAALQAERTGAVPIFWLATEDHDVAEVSSINLPAGDHTQKISVNVPHTEGAPVGSMVFGAEIAAAAQQVSALFGNAEAPQLLAESYLPGENFGSAFARFYSRLFADIGIIFLNPLDAELHRIALPVFKQSLAEWKQINDALQQRNHDLEAAGYHAQVKVTPSHTLCFYFQDGVRTPVRSGTDGFLIGERKLSEAELVAEAERCPERFSANVLLRPIMEDYLLPTLCYIGGPSETAYFAQAAVVYEKLLGRVTPVVPRISATLIEPRLAKLLDRYQLSLQDIFRGPEKLRELLAGKALPESTIRSFDAAAAHIDEALALIHDPLKKLDPTLADAAENAGSKMRYQLQSLREKAIRAEARKNEETQRHADELSTLLYPNKELQEREIGAAYFLLKYGTGVVDKIREGVRLDCADHQLIRLQT